MADGGPMLDYAKSPPRPSWPWQAGVVMALLVLGSTTVCTCGHLNGIALPFTAGAAVLSWRAAIRGDPRRIGRIILVALVILASLAVMKNVADVLWFGHHPLLRNSIIELRYCMSKTRKIVILLLLMIGSSQGFVYAQKSLGPTVAMFFACVTVGLLIGIFTVMMSRTREP